MLNWRQYALSPCAAATVINASAAISTFRWRLPVFSSNPYRSACLDLRLSISAPVMTGTCIGTRMNTTDQNKASPNGHLCRASRSRAQRHGDGDGFEPGSLIHEETSDANRQFRARASRRHHGDGRVALAVFAYGQ